MEREILEKISADQLDKERAEIELRIESTVDNEVKTEKVKEKDSNEILTEIEIGDQILGVKPSLPVEVIEFLKQFYYAEKDEIDLMILSEKEEELQKFAADYVDFGFPKSLTYKHLGRIVNVE